MADRVKGAGDGSGGDPGRAKGVRRLLLLAFGWFCVGLGFIGVFLPVLPTTPFLILALWAFAQSSERFHGWLYQHRFFGPRLRAWHEHRVIPLRAKLLAWGVMTLSLSYVIYKGTLPWWALLFIAACMGFGAGFIFYYPSRPRD
jgi:uncharacterized membrane protein YbaN (DUF454 family)